jgi:hypothetical protein
MDLRNVGLKKESQSGIGNEKRCTPASGLAPHLAIGQDTILARHLLRRCYIPCQSFLSRVVSKLMALIFGPRVSLRWARPTIP